MEVGRVLLVHTIFYKLSNMFITWTGCLVAVFIHVINMCLASLAGLFNVSVKENVI
jgi:hypothetical protein